MHEFSSLVQMNSLQLSHCDLRHNPCIPQVPHTAHPAQRPHCQRTLRAVGAVPTHKPASWPIHSPPHINLLCLWKLFLPSSDVLWETGAWKTIDCTLASRENGTKSSFKKKQKNHQNKTPLSQSQKANIQHCYFPAFMLGLGPPNTTLE